MTEFTWEFRKLISDKELALKQALIDKFGELEALGLFNDLIAQFVDENLDFVGYQMALDKETHKLKEKKNEK